MVRPKELLIKKIDLAIAQSNHYIARANTGGNSIEEAHHYFNVSSDYLKEAGRYIEEIEDNVKNVKNY